MNEPRSIPLLKRINDSSLIKAAGVYTFSTLINSAIPFFMMPILTRYLNPHDYGIVSMFYVLVGIVNPIVGLSLHGAVTVKYFELAKPAMSKFVWNCFLLMLAGAVIMFGLIWLLAGPIEGLTAFPRNWLWTLLLVSAGQTTILITMTLWQVQKEAFKYAVFQNLQTLMNVTLAIVFVVGMAKHWQGRIMAEIITVSFFAVSGYLILGRNGWLKFSVDTQQLKSALRFGLPLIPHALGSLLIFQTDRIFITKMVSVADTGIYTVGYQVAMVIELCAASFNRAYVPWLYGHLKKDDPDMKKRIVLLTYAYFILILLFAAGVAFVAPWFLRFFVGKSFAGAYRYTAWIAFGFAFSGMYYMVTNYIFFVGKNHLLAWVTFVTAVINIALNYVLIKLNGAIGAAQASAAAFFMSFVLTWFVSAKVYQMPWNIGKLFGQGKSDQWQDHDHYR